MLPSRINAIQTITCLIFTIGVFAAPLVFAQQAAKAYRIGYVTTGSPNDSTTTAFRQGLREAGYTEGKDIFIEARYAKGQQERLSGLVAEVIRQKVDVLVAGSTLTALAAKHATTTIPIVFASVFDPVAAGIVPSLGRPGGNITGVAIGVGGGFGGKWLEFLKETVPGISHVAVLWNPANQSSAQAAEAIRAAGRSLGVKLEMLDAANAETLDKSLNAIVASRAQGIIVAPDPYFNTSRERLVQFAARNRLPAVYFFQTFAEAGGLIAYGTNHEDSYRIAAGYVDRILKGAKPADLPVEQPTRFELVINMRTAKALGMKFPPSLLLRADRVIE